MREKKKENKRRNTRKEKEREKCVPSHQHVRYLPKVPLLPW
jgi:hypothetical protein